MGWERVGKLTDQKEEERQGCVPFRECELCSFGLAGTRGIGHLWLQVYDISNNLQEQEESEHITINTRVLGA